MINSGELLFVKSVKDGVPNRDPLMDSDARRIFGEEDGRISLSDVSVKRDVRDYIIVKYEDGGEKKDKFIFVREERNEKGMLLGRKSIGEKIVKDAGLEKEAKKDMESALKKSAFDVRTFGAVYSVTGNKFNLIGPVQFGWSHSMHPVNTKYIQGTTVLPSKDIKDAANEEEKTEGVTQGTIWTSYTLPFAVFIMPAVINANIAKQTKMDTEDQELLLEALWRGTQHRQARNRGFQQPLFMVHVEYKDPFFRIGYLEDYVKLLPEREQWTMDVQPTSVNQIQLDITKLSDILNANKDKIARCRYWKNPALKFKGEMFGEQKRL